jgi:hypothetical protein
VSRIRARWVWNKGARYFVYMKLDPVKVEWIVKQKEKGTLTTKEIAERMGISPLWVKALWRRYREGGKVPALMRPGRRKVETSEHEREVIGRAREAYGVGAVVLERVGGRFQVRNPYTLQQDTQGPEGDGPGQERAQEEGEEEVGEV